MLWFTRRPPWRHPLGLGLATGLAAVLVLGLGIGLALVHARLAHAANTTDKKCTSASYASDITTVGASGMITFICSSPADIDVRTGSGGPGTVTVAASSNLTIASIGASVTLDGAHAVQLFVVNGHGSLTLDHIIVANGWTNADGGGVLNRADGTLTITDSTFSGDTATGALDINPNGFANGGIADGGGLANFGMATITDSTFSRDSAIGGSALASGSVTAVAGSASGGALVNEGTVTITGSTFSGDSATGGAGVGSGGAAGFGGGASGGALSNGGTLTIVGSTFSGDSAIAGGGANTDATSYGVGGDAFGGALFNGGLTTPTTITGSTFSDDSAAGGRGNGALGGRGGTGAGGALLSIGTVTIANTTLTRNAATGGTGTSGAFGGNGFGGALDMGATATLTNATLSGNSADFGGAVAARSHTITVTNSIVAANTAGGTPGPNCYQSGGTVADGGNNLEDGSDPTDCGFSTSALYNDQFATTTSQLGLGSLGNHGGPTQTMALKPGSLALGHANLAVCTTPPVDGVDQRGVHRPQGTECDIGAFELERPFARLRVDGPIFVAPGVPNIRYITSGTSLILTAATSRDGVAPASASYCVTAAASRTCSTFTTVQAGSLPATFAITGGDGPYTVSFYASDSFGDQGAIQTAAYTVDNTPPAATLSIGQPQATVNGVVEVTSRTPLQVSATDAGSGVVSVSYRFFPVGGAAPAFISVGGARARFKLTGGNGVYEVDYLATDHVGNVRSYSVTMVLANGQLHAPTQP